MENYINTAVSGLIFVWMIRVERIVAEIRTTCKLNGGCDDKRKGKQRRKKGA